MHRFQGERNTEGGVTVVCSCKWESKPAASGSQYDKRWQEFFEHQASKDWS